ncbi:MAG: hypothetical protein MZV70_72895 [Desulfobacterales bacterium]|nr:hypothetical protein [Desulfobacterales bacterium]
MSMGVGVSCIYGCSHHLDDGNVGFFKVPGIPVQFALLLGYLVADISLKLACQFTQLIVRIDPERVLCCSILQFVHACRELFYGL